LTARGIGFKVLTGHGANIDTTSPGGKLVFGIFAALAEFERELIIERTKAGMAAARARGRNGGRPYKMTPAKLRLAMVSIDKPETRISDLCAELGITHQTLYRHVDPKGKLRPDGDKLLQRPKNAVVEAAIKQCVHIDNLLSVTFEAHSREENHHHRYQITVGRDLLDDWTVAIHYGRTGQGGREIRFASPKPDEMRTVIRDRLRRRLSAPKRINCPYRLTALNSAPGFDASVWLPGDVMAKFFQTA
jgi:hypothetical protein